MKPDLRTVPVGDHDAPTPLDDIDQEGSELGDGPVLIEDRRVRFIAHQCIAAERDDGPSHASNPGPHRSAIAARAAVKHASGAVVMPAPIWPTPASRWAIPVLMTGTMPVSTTVRTSTSAGVGPK